MAMLPCTQCGQRFRGEAASVYVQHYDGDQVEAYRLLLCEPCTEELLHEIREKGLFRNDDGEWEYADGNSEPKWLPVPHTRPSRR